MGAHPYFRKHPYEQTGEVFEIFPPRNLQYCCWGQRINLNGSRDLDGVWRVISRPWWLRLQSCRVDWDTLGNLGIHGFYQKLRWNSTPNNRGLRRGADARGGVSKKLQQPGIFSAENSRIQRGWQALGMKPKKLLLAKKQMTEELRVGHDFEMQRRAFDKSWLAKWTRRIMMDVCFCLFQAW